MLPGLRRGAFLPLLIGISIVLSKSDYTFAASQRDLEQARSFPIRLSRSVFKKYFR